MEHKYYLSEAHQEELLNGQFKKLNEFGKFNKELGSFEYLRCICDGPLLGHITKCEEGCEKMSIDEIEQIESWLESFSLFIDNKNKLDDRITERICVKCNTVYENRFKSISHHRYFHKLKDYGMENVTHGLSEVDKRFDSIYQILQKQTEMISHPFSNGSHNTSFLMKSKKVPIWADSQDFDSFSRQLFLWNKQVKLTPESKFFEVTESLKMNTKIDGLINVTTHKILDNDNIDISQENIVDVILDILKENFGKNRIEKTYEIVSILGMFINGNESDPKIYLEKFERFLSKLERANMDANGMALFLSIIFIKHSMLNEIQTLLLIKHIEAFEDKHIIKETIKEFKKIMIESKTTDVMYNNYFRNNRSRSRNRSQDSAMSKSYSYGPSYNRNRSSSNEKKNTSQLVKKTDSSNFNRNKDRSISNDRRNTYKSANDSDSRGRSKERSNSQSKNEEKTRSVSRTCNHKCGKCEKVEDTGFVSMEKQIDNNYIEEIYFLDETPANQLIVDSGAPKNIVGRPWLEQYLKKNKFNENQVKRRLTDSKKFRFGPSKILISSEIYEIPIIIKGNEPGTEYNILRVQVYVLDASVPFLISKEQLQAWNVIQSFTKNDEQLIIRSFKPQIIVNLVNTSGNHLAINLEENKSYSEEDVINYVNNLAENDEVSDYKSIKKVHQVLGHAGELPILHFYKNAGRMNNQTRKNIKKVLNDCQVCNKRKKSLGTPKVAVPHATEFNQIITADLKDMSSKFILWIVDSFTKFMLGIVIKDKRSETIVKAIIIEWCHKFGFPSEAIYQDNGSEFQNKDMESLASRLNLQLKYGPCYSPWSNGTNERNHYSADQTVQKLLDDDSSLSLEDAVSAASWCHNVCVTKNGFSPLQLLTGRAIVLPGVLDGNLATESFISESDAVRTHIELIKKAQEIFRKKEYGDKLKLAEKTRISCFNNIIYKKGDRVFYQDQGKKQWVGPAEVFEQSGRTVWIHANGRIKKLASCHVYPQDLNAVMKQQEISTDWSSDNPVEITNEKHNDNTEDIIKFTGTNDKTKHVNDDLKQIEEFMSGKCQIKHQLGEVRPKRGTMVMLNMLDGTVKIGKITDVNKNNSVNKFKCWLKESNGTKTYIDFENEVNEWVYIQEKCEDLKPENKQELLQDNIGSYYLEMANDDSLDEELLIYSVEIPKCRHNEPQVVEAKLKELQNFKNYNAICEVEDKGQNRIGSRWVITEKEKQDGQKYIIKARLVVRGFQEIEKPKCDSPTALRESFRTFMSIAGNENFDLVSVDITAAFLQSEELDRIIFVEPPHDIKLPGKIWRLNKPVYGLDDASRKFWLKIDQLLKSKGLRTVSGDNSFYFLNDGKELKGMILCHVDDFLIGGLNYFIEDVIGTLRSNFEISKIERGHFRFTGIDITKTSDSIKVNMDDYANNIQEIKLFRDAHDNESLTKYEMKLFRKYTGKLQWLSDNVRPDLAIIGLKMSTLNKSATLGDLKKINKMVKILKSRGNEIIFRQLGPKEKLIVYGIGDASYKCSEKSIGGTLVLLGSKNNINVSPLFWKSKTIQQVCLSAKDAETRTMLRLADDSMYLARTVSEIVFSLKTQVCVELFTDSRSLLESIASTKQVDRKIMRNTVAALKEYLSNDEISSYSWLSTEMMVADMLTKEKRNDKVWSSILIDGKLDSVKNKNNIVFYDGQEFKIENIAGKK